MEDSVEKIWKTLLAEAKSIVIDGDLDSLMRPSPDSEPLRRVLFQNLAGVCAPKPNTTATEIFVKDTLLLSLYLAKDNKKDPAETAKDFVDLYRMLDPAEGNKLNEKVIATHLQDIVQTIDTRIVPAIPRMPLLALLASAVPIDQSQLQRLKTMCEHTVYFLDRLSQTKPYSDYPDSGKNVESLARMFDRGFSQRAKTNLDPIVQIRKTYDTRYGVTSKPANPGSAPVSTIDEPALKAALAELDAMTGLEGTKGSVNLLVSHLRVTALRAAAGLKNEPVTLHMMFSGNPGTGKTTVGRICGKIFKAMGLLEKGTFTEARAADLIGEHVGSSAPKTRKLVQSAIGGVLFIDEAYSLVASNPFEKGSSFAQEAIAELLAQMENHRDNLVVIFAGYPDEMQQLLKSNPGMPRRIGTQVDFKDFPPAQLLSIFKTMASSRDYTVAPETEQEVLRVINEEYAKRGKSFGNAGLMRNLCDKAILQQAARIAEMVKTKAPTREDLMTLTAEDIKKVDLSTDIKIEKPPSNYAGKSRIGFMADALPPPVNTNGEPIVPGRPQSFAGHASQVAALS